MGMPEKLVRALHATSHQAVLEVAGAGTQAIAWIHAIGGSSRTLVEATDRYSDSSLESLLGYLPVKAVTTDVAIDMAKAALGRAKALSSPGIPVVGVGCTGALATDRHRRGLHHAIVAVADFTGVTLKEIQLAKGIYSRQEEEEIISTALLMELAAAFGLIIPECARLNITHAEFHPGRWLSDLNSGAIDFLVLGKSGKVVRHLPCWSEKAILSGSFNPLHKGHLELCNAASKFLQRTVFFELPLVNADKGTVELEDARRRINQFTGHQQLVVSHTALFSIKAKLFPGVVFVIGMDTAVRLVDIRFYNGSRTLMLQALTAIENNRCRFLVASRESTPIGIADVVSSLPVQLRAMFSELPRENFLCNVSSTEIRLRGIFNEDV